MLPQNYKFCYYSNFYLNVISTVINLLNLQVQCYISQAQWTLDYRLSISPCMIEDADSSSWNAGKIDGLVATIFDQVEKV